MGAASVSDLLNISLRVFLVRLKEPTQESNVSLAITTPCYPDCPRLAGLAILNCEDCADLECTPL